ncbi:head maturation protease, ClpP-related [Pelosinus baikalensis]|uniref:ATP-dependent Clp protease proteolytic subunit n=1 Tax=Pelosinus baikalensis TaxID=2892015 RepID=A0ABS8HUI5_9FIRM|nr:head maturation protease, ClpP-related [Pelosinus baikalensis]MCC5465549.1 Clp protease ClpP [Pelosinus baikalensis]
MRENKFDLQLFATKEIPKVEIRLEVKNETTDTADLFLYGSIRQSYWWDDEGSCISANGVRKSLESLKGKTVNIHINSPGGDVFESIAICNLLKQHDADINIYIDAMAGSGASLLATAGKNVYMFNNSMQMIHNAWTIASGNAAALRKTADDLDKIDAAVKASYMSRFVGTEDELTKLLADESYLTAAECLAFGLCTEIIEDKQEEEPPQNNIKTSLFAKYNKVPKEDGKKPSIFNAFKK